MIKILQNMVSTAYHFNNWISEIDNTHRTGAPFMKWKVITFAGSFWLVTVTWQEIYTTQPELCCTGADDGVFQEYHYELFGRLDKSDNKVIK